MMDKSQQQQQKPEIAKWLTLVLGQVKSISEEYGRELEAVVVDYLDKNLDDRSGGKLVEDEDHRNLNRKLRSRLAQVITSKFQLLTQKTEKNLENVVSSSVADLEKKIPLANNNNNNDDHSDFSTVVNTKRHEYQSKVKINNNMEQEGHGASYNSDDESRTTRLRRKRIKPIVFDEDDAEVDENVPKKSSKSTIKCGKEDDVIIAPECENDSIQFVPSSSSPKAEDDSSSSTASEDELDFSQNNNNNNDRPSTDVSLSTFHSQKFSGFTPPSNKLQCQGSSSPAGPSSFNRSNDYFVKSSPQNKIRQSLGAASTTSCNFCASEVSDGIMLACCHFFCVDCLKNRIKSCEGKEIFCPLECGHELYSQEIRSCVSPGRYDLSTGSFANDDLQNLPIFRCKTPGCPGCCMIDDDDEVETRRKIFLCPVCNKQSCIECNGSHEGISCGKYKELRAQAERSGVKVSDADLLQKAEMDGFGCQEMSKLFQDIPKDNMALFYDAAGRLLEDLKVIETDTEFECLICSRMNQSEAGGRGVVLQNCAHCFCRDCIVEIIKNSEKIPVPCPHSSIDNGPCKEFLTPAEFKSLAPADVYEKHIRWGWRHAENALANKYSCLKPNCDGFWEIDEGAQTENYVCPVCSSLNCVGCNTIHEGSTCEQYQEEMRKELIRRRDADDNDEEWKELKKNELASEAEIFRLLRDKTFMHCPHCRYICERISGCQHMKCFNPACGKLFTWKGKAQPTGVPSVPPPAAPRVTAPRRPRGRGRGRGRVSGDSRP